jgi:hypothetical protein
MRVGNRNISIKAKAIFPYEKIAFFNRKRKYNLN